MKLKSVVASVSLLGLIAAPAVASANSKFASHTAHSKFTNRVAHTKFASMSQPVQAVADQNFDNMLVASNHNTGRSGDGLLADWTSLIKIHGGFNADVHSGARWGESDLTPGSYVKGIAGMDGKAMSINDLYLSLYSRINDWTEARASVDYFSTSNSYTFVRKNSRYADGAAYSPAIDQAFVTFGNMHSYPVYLQVGKSYLPFGNYDLHPLVKPMTQVLSEANVENAQLGVMTDFGLSGGVYGFESRSFHSSNGASASPATNPMAYGAYLNFANQWNNIGYDVGLGYLDNMLNTQIMTAKLAYDDHSDYYASRVSGLALHANASVGSFDFRANYVGALSRYSESDLSFKTGEAARPWAYGLQAGYGFDMPVVEKHARGYLGFQHSGEASALNLPENRWEAGVSVDVLKNTMVDLNWTNNRSYGSDKLNFSNDTAMHRVSNTIGLRVGVNF